MDLVLGSARTPSHLSSRREPATDWLTAPLVRMTIMFQGGDRPYRGEARAIAGTQPAPVLVPLGSSLDAALRGAAELVRRAGERTHHAMAVLQASDGAYHGALLGINDRPVFVDGPAFPDLVRLLSLGRLHPDVRAVVGGESWFDVGEGYSNRPQPLPAG